jgi:signal peptidase II
MTRMGLLSAVLVACVGCDQVTKIVATRTLAPLPPQSYLGGILRLEYVRNPGAFLGMGGNLSPQQRFWFLTVVNALAMLVLGYVLVTRWNMPPVRFAAWALVLAGGIGNLIDRVGQQGLVTDFLNLRLGPFRTGIFNVADMAITTGFGLFLWIWWRDERKAQGPLPQ